jgi:outer membrane autotransporter protein
VGISGETTFTGTLTATGATTLDVAGALRLSAAAKIDGSATVTKNGAGTLAVNGLISAPLDINDGTFEVNGTVSGPVNFNAGTLTGNNGTLSDVTFAAGTTIAPGNAGSLYGTLTLGSADSTTKFEALNFLFDLNSATGEKDVLNVAGAALFGAGNSVDLSDALSTSWTDASFTLLTATGGLTTNVSDLDSTTFTYRGTEMTGDRLRVALAVVDGTKLQLTTYASANLSLIWNGDATQGTWEKTSSVTTNWLEGTEARDFQDGDIVAFLDRDVERKVSVDSRGVIVGDLVIGEGAAYEFNGGSITGLEIAHVPMKNAVTGAAEELTSSGSLSIGEGASALFNSGLDFKAITVAGNAVFNGSVTSATALVVSETGTATLKDSGAFNLDVAVNGALVFDQASDYEYRGAVTGTGSLTKSGAGVLTLKGASAYGATNVLGGTLSLGSDANIGGGVNTLNGGALRLTGNEYASAWVLGANGGTIETAGTALFSGVLSDAGALTKAGTGTLVLAANNTYTGGTTVAQGELRIAGTLGTGSTGADASYAGKFALAEGSVLNFASNANQVLTGTISGDAGTLAKTGTGTLVLAGTAQRTVGEFVNNAGTTRIESDFTATRGVLNNAVLAFNQNQIHGDVTNSLSGSLQLSGTGTAVIDGRLINSGHVYFENFGKTLQVKGLANATTGAPGYYHLDVDFSWLANSDRVLLDGEDRKVSGTHVFVVNGTGGDKVLRTTTYDLIQNAEFEEGSQVLLSGPVFAGLYHFAVVGTENATLRVVGYSAGGQAAANTIGSISTGWFSQLDNLHKRSGDLRLEAVAQQSRKATAAPVAETKDAGTSGTRDANFTESLIGAHANDFWVRGYGQQLDTKLGKGLSNFKEFQYGGDVGADRTFAFDADNALYLGASVGYQSSNRKFHDGFGSKGTTESVVGGAYATWLNKEGWFVDGVVKAQHFNNEFDTAGDHARFDTYGVGASLEIGRRLEAGAWFAEPSAQFSYTHLFTEGFTSDGNTSSGRLHVKTGDTDIYRYVAALRAGRVWDLQTLGVVEPYVKVSVEYQESDGGSLRISGTSLTPNTDGSRVNLGLGVSWQFTSRQQIFLDYEASVGDKYDKPWGVNAGYRLRF